MASPTMSPQSSASLQQQIQMARARVQTGANWFIIIAALSVVNTLISMGGGRLRFIFGLGVTTYVDAFAHSGGPNAKTTQLVLSVFFAAFIAMFGFFGRKEQKWAFVVGMGLYLCDGLLLLPAGVYLDAAFHLWGLFRIYQGFQGMTALETLRSQAANAGAVSTSWNR